MDLAAAIRHLSTLQGEHEAEAQLLGAIGAVAPYESDRAAGSSSGVNVTQVVAFEDSTAPEGYFKSHEGLDPLAAHHHGQTKDSPPLNECAAWQLAKRLGDPYAALVAPSVYRVVDGRPGSVSQLRGGRPNFDAAVATAREDVLAAGFFDCLIGQQDRHARQHRWGAAERRLFLIDHGYAFLRRTNGTGTRGSGTFGSRQGSSWTGLSSTR